MLNISLPEELEKEYYAIRKKYNSIKDEWRKYRDETIPEDKQFAQRIICFIIKVIDHVIDNFEEVDLNEYQTFLAQYDYEFFYGPNGDDENYLTFDERLDGTPVTEFCWELKDETVTLTKEILEDIKSKYVRVLTLF